MKKSIMLIVIILLSLVLVGCIGNNQDPIEQINDELEITNQVTKWNSAWTDKDTTYFRDTMVAEDIYFSYYWGSSIEKFTHALSSIDDFIKLITKTEHWELWHFTYNKCNIINAAVTITGSTAVVKGLWSLDIPEQKPYPEMKVKMTITFQVMKIDNKWLINSIALGEWETL